MLFKKNTNLIGAHAFLSPSTHTWLYYDEDKLRRTYFSKQLAARGDKLHAYAQQAIELKLKQADNATTMSMYVNDAIGFRMEPEIPLFYSIDCFGTCDAIGIREERWPDGMFLTLRISDLKTGVNPADMDQLYIYCGIFFHEYSSLFKPENVRVILRIYQNDEIVEVQPDAVKIRSVMSQIKYVADMVRYLREED